MCQIQLGQRARATRDLDGLFHGSLDGLLADLDTAFVEPYSGFSFSYAPPEAVRETGAHRYQPRSPACRCDIRSHKRSTPVPSASQTVKTSASTT
jgi:hypothetical protein